MTGAAANLAPLPLVDMTEAELADELMANFPLRWPLAKCRRALETMVRRAGEREISPFTVEMAYVDDRRRVVERWPPEVRWRKLSEAERGVLRRCAPEWAAKRDAAAGTRPAAAKAEDWSFT